jgi:hypothetical protein
MSKAVVAYVAVVKGQEGETERGDIKGKEWCERMNQSFAMRSSA